MLLSTVMKRRLFIAGGAAVFGSALASGGCGTNPWLQRALTARDLALSSVRRLQVVRVDPLSGRCVYVADTGHATVDHPILHARTGESFDFVIENLLPQPTTVHFHGLGLPEASDGAGFDPIPPGESRRVRFDIRDRSGLYWMHSHAHGFTAEQVHAGLAALLVVHDDEDAALDEALALAAGNRLALALADVRESNGVLRPYSPGERDCLHGWYGNRMLVNGALDASIEVYPGWVRLQLLNACNARGLLLGLTHARHGETGLARFHLIGTDGGLLAEPREVDRVFLYGGERVDIAIEIPANGVLQANSLAFDARHQIRGKWPGHAHPARHHYPGLAAAQVCASRESIDSVPADGARMSLFSLRASAAIAPQEGRMPSRLSSLTDARTARFDVDRRLRLDFDDQNGFVIDNLRYRIDEPGFAITRGTREIWEIRNSPISMPHAMHLHGFHFRVLRRQGTFGPARALATESNARMPTDLGLKDTVVVWPNETLWLEVDFSLPAGAAFRGPQRYMFHCHNLEHEDGMMMRNLVVN